MSLETKIEELKSTTENLTDHLTDYAETYVQLGVVKATGKLAEATAHSLTSIVVVLLGLFVLLFAGIGVAVWLGEVWGDPKAGYFAVGGALAAVILTFALLRRKVIFPALRDFLVKKIHE